MNIVRIKISPELLREFLQNVLACDYGISNSLFQELKTYKKNVSELTNEESNELAAKVFTDSPINGFFNLKDDKDNLLLPIIYNDFHFKSTNNELFTLGKFGIQCIDLFNLNGKIIYKDAFWIDFHTEYFIEIWTQDTRTKIFKYRVLEQDLKFLGEPNNLIMDRLISFNESLFYFNGGFVDEDFKATTPMCFDNGKYFSEGLAPVCLNGKWGYINKKSEIVIDFIFGDAEPFENGIAKVFILKPEFQNENGVWIEGVSNTGYSNEMFLELFPEFPKKTRKPLPFLREINKTKEELINEYHCYAEGINDDYGYWTKININGKIIIG